jgi:hypothetical protein
MLQSGEWRIDRCSSPTTCLLMLEKDTKTTGCDLPQNLQSPLNHAARGGKLGSCQGSGVMCLEARMSCSERALLSRFRPTHRAADGQYTPQRQLLSFHANIIPTIPVNRWSIVLSCFFSGAGWLNRESIWARGI